MNTLADQVIDLETKRAEAERSRQLDDAANEGQDVDDAVTRSGRGSHPTACDARAAGVAVALAAS